MKENLNSKLADIRKQKEQLMANYNALCGAEQMLQQLIKELESDESEKDNG